MSKVAHCDNCGKEAALYKTIAGFYCWEWWCEDCLEEDDDGYVVQLT